MVTPGLHFCLPLLYCTSSTYTPHWQNCSIIGVYSAVHTRVLPPYYLDFTGDILARKRLANTFSFFCLFEIIRRWKQDRSTLHIAVGRKKVAVLRASHTHKSPG